MIKIGLFGGSFDPVHMGHLLVAQAAREELGLTRIFFIPAAQSPFKIDSKPATPAQRLQLLRLALAGHTHTEIDTQELERGGISYTVDTVRNYTQRFPGAKLYYLIGADHVAQLPQWRRAEELASMTEVLVIPRPGQVSASIPMPFQGQMLRGFPIDVSSSQIRARRRSGKPIKHLVPAAVAEAIENNELYF